MCKRQTWCWSAKNATGTTWTRPTWTPEALEHYQAQDYHRMYLGEITQVLRRV